MVSPADRQVEGGRWRGRHHLGSHEREPAERREVQKEYAPEREPAQGVEDVQALGCQKSVAPRGWREVVCMSAGFYPPDGRGQKP